MWGKIAASKRYTAWDRDLNRLCEPTRRKMGNYERPEYFQTSNSPTKRVTTWTYKQRSIRYNIVPVGSWSDSIFDTYGYAEIVLAVHLACIFILNIAWLESAFMTQINKHDTVLPQEVLRRIEAHLFEVAERNLYGKKHMCLAISMVRPIHIFVSYSRYSIRWNFDNRICFVKSVGFLRANGSGLANRAWLSASVEGVDKRLQPVQCFWVWIVKTIVQMPFQS